MRYCQNCGSSVDDDAKFCPNCGSNVEIAKKESEERVIYSTAIDDDSSQIFNETYPKKNQKKRKIIAGVVIAFVLLASVGIIVPITLLSMYGPLDYRHIGDLDYSFDSTTVEILSFDFDTFEGDIEVYADMSQSELVVATVDVYGRSDSTLIGATNFENSSNGNSVSIIFVTESYSTFDTTARYYDLDITINPKMICEFNINTFSGSIDFDFGDAESSIREISMNTFSGDIYAAFGYNTIINAESFSFESSSGSINTHVESNSKINVTEISYTTFSGDITASFREHVEIKCDTIILDTESGFATLDLLNTNMEANHLIGTAFSGYITFDFSYYTNLTIPDISIDTSSGIIFLQTDDYIFNGNASWDIETFSGDIFIDIIPDMSSSKNSTLTFDVTSSSGKIDVEYDFSEIIVGLQASASTTSGNIDLPGGTQDDFYQSDYFDTRHIKYIFNLETFSGDIDISQKPY